MTGLGDAGVAALARSKVLRPECLTLMGTRLGDRGLEALAASPVLRRVAELRLDLNRVGDRGLLALARSRWVRHLRLLTVCENPVTDRGLPPLRDRLPDLELQHRASDIPSRVILEELFDTPYTRGNIRLWPGQMTGAACRGTTAYLCRPDGKLRPRGKLPAG